MKKILLIIIFVSLFFIMCGCSDKSQEYFRIHIRANSNTQIDQNVKYLVRDAVVEYLTSYVEDAETIEDAQRIVSEQIPEIEKISNDILYNNGFSYKSKAYCSEEEFPTRSYGNLTLNNGVYSALIVELGEGCGDNWWCVIFPPLCFVSANDDGVEYKSYIVELVKKMLQK